MFFSSFIKDYFFRAENVSFTKKGESFIVLSLDRKNIIELKDVAFTIWQNLQKPISFAALLEKVKNEYDAPEETLKKDLEDWLKEALKEKIIERQKEK